MDGVTFRLGLLPSPCVTVMLTLEVTVVGWPLTGGTEIVIVAVPGVLLAMKTNEATPPLSGLLLPPTELEPVPAIEPIDGADTVALISVPSVSGVPLRRVTVTVSVAVELVPIEVADTSMFTLSAGGGPKAEARA